ncbi:hypothetical protein EZV62_025466 [Acer yangbiense]|uniref:O-methyltransferase dimerisation domain-containing protein n=1 Tax=Acer yangbiense TaxID=1000413 RepID=A0A5C7GYE1_9ROSI|nr:hypothetical protein EZV62_025466 [Acer yangbiense]
MSIVLLPMSLHTAIELGIFEIIAEASPGAKLYASEIAVQLPTSNPDAAAMLLLCPYTLCLTKMVFHFVTAAQRVKVKVLLVRCGLNFIPFHQKEQNKNIYINDCGTASRLTLSNKSKLLADPIIHEQPY